MAMSVKKVLEGLEQACREKGVRLIYDELSGEGGLCRLRDSYYIIINRRAAAETRVRIIRGALEQVPAPTERREEMPALETAADRRAEPAAVSEVAVADEEHPAGAVAAGVSAEK